MDVFVGKVEGFDLLIIFGVGGNGFDGEVIGVGS